MFGFRRKVTLEDFAQELVRFSLSELSLSASDEARYRNDAIKRGANPKTYLFETVFFRCMETWHALFTAQARKKLTVSQWQFLNERFLVSVMDSLSSQAARQSPWDAPLAEILHERLVEYRDATAGTDSAAMGTDAICRVFAKVCSGDPMNEALFKEAKIAFMVGANQLVDVISNVKFIA